MVVPDDVGQVLLGPPDRGPPSVQSDDLGADLRVRRACRRVGDDGRHPGGVGRVGDVPALNGRVVDAGDDQRIARWRPPVAAHALHLLGGDEVGEPVADVRPVRRGEGAGRPGCEVVHVQRLAADVGDVSSLRVGARVDDPAGRVDRPRGPVEEVRDVEAPGQGERCRPHLLVGGVADDAARLLAGALATGPFLGREVLVGGVEGERVADEAFRAGGEVERPQTGDGVGAAAAAQEDDPVAVRRERQAARHSKGEAAGTGLATRKTVGHAWQSAATASAPVGVAAGRTVS